MTAPRLVIFDVDGTLIDSQHQIVAAMVHAFGAAGLPPPPREEILSIVGLSLPEAMRALAPHLPEGDTRALAGHYRDGFVGQRACGAAVAPLYPGARAALDRLASTRTLLGVATGKARRGLDHILAAHDLGGRFVTAQTSDSHPSKPHPSMIMQALADARCAPEHTVMVGDTSFDIEMGRAAGVATIGVSWGYHPTEALASAGADAVIDGFGALDAALLQVCGGQ